MKIKMEHKAGDLTFETLETTLEELLAVNDFDEAEVARITDQLQTGGKVRVAGFVGSYVDLTKINGEKE